MHSSLVASVAAHRCRALRFSSAKIKQAVVIESKNTESVQPTRQASKVAESTERRVIDSRGLCGVGGRLLSIVANYRAFANLSLILLDLFP